MRLRSWCLLVSLLLVMTGCNLAESTPPTAEPLQTNTPVVTGVPEVTIISPSDGAEFAVNEPVIVSVDATDPIGVTRVQLFANDQIVKSVSSESPDGDPALDAVLDYTPRTTGEVALRVIAYRGTVASEPAEIRVTVISETQPTATSSSTDGGGGGGPIIPNDGVCRVLTNVGLNFRNEPTTTRDNVITVVPGGTLAPIAGRLGDNSWWQISYSGRIGWVSGNSSYTTLYGNCSTVPVENVIINSPTPTFTPFPTATPTATPSATPTATPTTPGRPDLIVPTIVIDNDEDTDSITLPSGANSVTFRVSVTITNAGNGAAGRFSNEIRFNGETYDLPDVNGLGSAESVVLTRDIDATETGDFDVRVTADSTNAIPEQIETNNTGSVPLEIEGQIPGF